MTLCAASSRCRHHKSSGCRCCFPTQTAGVNDAAVKVSAGYWGLSVTTVASCPACLPSHCSCFSIIALRALSLCQSHHFTFWLWILMKSWRWLHDPPSPGHPTTSIQTMSLYPQRTGSRQARVLIEAPAKRAVTQNAAVPLTLTLQRKSLLYRHQKRPRFMFS